MTATAIILIGFMVLTIAAGLDDIRQRKYNEHLRQRLALLHEELEEADAQSAAYMETIARERTGKACGSKGTCKCG